MSKRFIEIAVVSDVHLGTFGCHARELNNYLKSISPRTLVLNGDIIDIWQLNKNYFPAEHTKVLRRILKMMQQGTQVYYITGNHDEYLRKFSQLQLGNLKLVNQLTLQINQETFWFFHGDVFDVTMQYSKFLAKLGGKGYDYLIILNRAINYVLQRFGKNKLSLSKKVKDRVKKAAKFISDFEQNTALFAHEKGVKYVICGHIHEPCIKEIKVQKETIHYLNAGDWVENLSALEYNLGEWKLRYYKDLYIPTTEEDLDITDFNIQSIINKAV